MIGYAYPEPVRGSGKRHGGGTVASRVELSDDGPDERTPGGGEGDDEKAGEDDEDVAGGGAVRKLTDKSVDQETADGPESTNDERHATAALLNDVETTESASNIDTAENDLGDVGVLKTDTAEDGRTIVEEEVGTGELLASLENDTDHDAAEHGRGSEHLVPLGVLAGSLLLELEANLGNLVVDGLVVGVDTTKASDGGTSLLLTALAESETRGLREEDHSTTEDTGEEETETDGDAPGSAAVHLVGAVVDHVGGPDTEGDEELVASNDHTTNDGGSALRLVHRDGDRESTNTHTSDETTDGRLSPAGLGGDFDDHANHAPEGREGNCQLATSGVRNFSNGERANEGTSTEKRDNGTLADSVESVLSLRFVPLAETACVIGHIEVTGNLTRGVTEPDDSQYLFH